VTRDRTPVDVEALLSNTKNLFNHVYHFVQDRSHPPGATHRGAAINVVDIKEQREEFLRELGNTAINWVYSKAKYDQLLQKELAEREGDAPNAHAQLAAQAKKKFRRGRPQGQFGELLLFNFLQYFCRAAPLLRKMPLTTNSAIERHGADAIHYANANGTNQIFVGEAKAYRSTYSFSQAFDTSISSILESFENLSSELELYVFDEFVEQPLSNLARSLKEGQLERTRYELVCVVAYHETDSSASAHTEEDIKAQIERIVEKRYNAVKWSSFQEVEGRVIERMHYVIFPIWKFDALLDAFEKSI